MKRKFQGYEYFVKREKEQEAKKSFTTYVWAMKYLGFIDVLPTVDVFFVTYCKLVKT